MHRVPVGLRAHDESNERFRHGYPRGIALRCCPKLPTWRIVDALDLEIGLDDQPFAQIIFVGHADVVEGALLVLFKVALVLQLEQQIADSTKTLAVVRSDSE